MNYNLENIDDFNSSQRQDLRIRLCIAWATYTANRLTAEGVNLITAAKGDTRKLVLALRPAGEMQITTPHALELASNCFYIELGEWDWEAKISSLYDCIVSAITDVQAGVLA